MIAGEHSSPAIYHIYTYRKTETAPVSAGVFLVRDLAVCELIAVCFIIF